MLSRAGAVKRDGAAARQVLLGSACCSCRQAAGVRCQHTVLHPGKNHAAQPQRLQMHTHEKQPDLSACVAARGGVHRLAEAGGSWVVKSWHPIGTHARICHVQEHCCNEWHVNGVAFFITGRSGRVVATMRPALGQVLWARVVHSRCCSSGSRTWATSTRVSSNDNEHIVEVVQSGATALVALNRPRSLNALSTAVRSSAHWCCTG